MSRFCPGCVLDLLGNILKKNSIESQPRQVLKSNNVPISGGKGWFLTTASALLELWMSYTSYSSC